MQTEGRFIKKGSGRSNLWTETGLNLFCPEKGTARVKGCQDSDLDIVPVSFRRGQKSDKGGTDHLPLVKRVLFTKDGVPIL